MTALTQAERTLEAIDAALAPGAAAPQATPIAAVELRIAHHAAAAPLTVAVTIDTPHQGTAQPGWKGRTRMDTPASPHATVKISPADLYLAMELIERGERVALTDTDGRTVVLAPGAGQHLPDDLLRP